MPGLIVAWHRIASGPGSRNRVHPARFSAQLDALCAAVRVVPLLDLVAAAGEGDEDRVALTFDDASVDALDEVAPALEARTLPATFFATGLGLNDEPAWWDLLERFEAAEAGLPLAAAGRSWPATTREDRSCTAQALRQRLLAATRAEVLGVCDALGRWLGGTTVSSFLDEAGLRRLAASSRFEIGSHGRHHLALTALSRAEAEAEVGGFAAELGRRLGRTVRLHAYAYGSWNPVAASVVAAAGLQAAVGLQPGRVTRSSPRFALPRFEVGDWTGEAFARWLASALAAR